MDGGTCGVPQDRLIAGVVPHVPGGIEVAVLLGGGAAVMLLPLATMCELVRGQFQA